LCIAPRPTLRRSARKRSNEDAFCCVRRQGAHMMTIARSRSKTTIPARWDGPTETVLCWSRIRLCGSPIPDFHKIRHYLILRRSNPLSDSISPRRRHPDPSTTTAQPRGARHSCKGTQYIARKRKTNLEALSLSSIDAMLHRFFEYTVHLQYSAGAWQSPEAGLRSGQPVCHTSFKTRSAFRSRACWRNTTPVSYAARQQESASGDRIRRGPLMRRPRRTKRATPATECEEWDHLPKKH